MSTIEALNFDYFIDRINTIVIRIQEVIIIIIIITIAIIIMVININIILIHKYF